MKYYILMCESPKDKDLAALSYELDYPMRSWVGGDRFNKDSPMEDEHPPKEPIRVEWSEYAEKEDVLIELYDEPIPLMTHRLHKALVEAGVKNLDTYAVDITNPKTKEVSKDYVAFNLVGLVAVADMKKSDYDPASMMFDGIVLDEAKLLGAPLMFRAKESVNAIFIAESVKKHIEDSGIDTLTFMEPTEWVG